MFEKNRRALPFRNEYQRGQRLKDISLKEWVRKKKKEKLYKSAGASL